MNGSPVKAGLFSGAVATIVAALAQLPLYAPTDTVFNSATVMVGGLAAGTVAGLLWRAIKRKNRGLGMFLGLWTGGFLVVVLLAVAGPTKLDRTISFVAPLAAIVFGITCALTVWLTPATTLRRRWLVPLAVAIAIGVGIGLATFGDQPSGELTLPPRAPFVITAD